SIRPAHDRIGLVGIHVPAPDARRAGSPTLYAVRAWGRSAGVDSSVNGPIALVQVTDLGVHARVGTNDAAVWLTGVNDGMPKAGATVVLYDAKGRTLASARTDALGLARMRGFGSKQKPDTTREVEIDEEGDGGSVGGEGYVKVTLGDDRAIASI